MEDMRGIRDQEYLSEEMLEHGRLQKDITLLEQQIEGTKAEIAQLNTELDKKDGPADPTAQEAFSLFARIEQLKPLLGMFERRLEHV
jgi:chromosome segregation ATPase